MEEKSPTLSYSNLTIYDYGVVKFDLNDGSTHSVSGFDITSPDTLHIQLKQYAYSYDTGKKFESSISPTEDFVSSLKKSDSFTKEEAQNPYSDISSFTTEILFDETSVSETNETESKSNA